MSEEKHDDVDLAQELRELGQQLKEAIRVAREHPQTKELERQVAQAVSQLTAQVERALQTAREREPVKRAQEQVKQTAQTLKESHAKEDIQRGLAKGVRAVNEQIARAIAQAEKSKTEQEPEPEAKSDQKPDEGPME